MTAQFNDKFIFRGTKYSVAGISEGELFDPATLDLEPSRACTACYRGYVATYSVVNDRLVIANLDVNLIEEGDKSFSRQEGPPINGIRPTGTEKEFDLFNNYYQGINYHLEYSGGILIADGFISNLYVHMGFHPAWKYEYVIELIFEKGRLAGELDRSEEMVEMRNKVDHLKGYSSESGPTRDEIRRFVESAFDRSYRL